MVFNDEDRNIIIELARALTGTNVNAAQHSVIVSNVYSRILAVGCRNLEDYLAYVDAHDDELDQLTSDITIHTTSWFREAGMFNQLEAAALKHSEKHSEKQMSQGVFRVLSVGCSTGEEVYSIAAFLEGVRFRYTNFEYKIDGWDIDPVSLRKAAKGCYSSTQIDNAPKQYRSLLQRIGRVSGSQFTVDRKVQLHCHFNVVNMAKPPVVGDRYHFIVCRNMLIYFTDEQIERIMAYFKKIMAQDASLSVGVAETRCVSPADFKSIGLATFVEQGISEKNHLLRKKTPLLTKITPHCLPILVIDDNAERQNKLAKLLADASLAVIKTDNTRDAMEILSRDRISMILSALRHDDQDSKDFMTAKHKKCGFDGPTVLVSELHSGKWFADVVSAGYDDVIVFPAQASKLIRLARYYLKMSIQVDGPLDLILIGASTGGPEAIWRLLSKMPPHCPPVVLVQHITANLAADFARRTCEVSGLQLGKMVDRAPLLPGHLYAALGDYHIGIREFGGSLSLAISSSPQIMNSRPAVDFLFHSASSLDRKIFATLLTGMGKDGASGLLALRKNGAETIAQDESSCVVFGMPNEAIQMNAAVEVLNIDEMRARIDLRINCSQKVS